MHDKRRFSFTARGERKGSYEQVVSRVKRLLDRYTARPVVARVTVTKGTVEIYVFMSI